MTIDGDLARSSLDAATVDQTATILVLAKAPVPGRVKTRLQSRYSPRESAALAQAALADTLATVRRHRVGRKVLVLEGDVAPWMLPEVEVIRQSAGDLGERIAAAFEAVLPGGGPALLIGMDTPQLDVWDLEVDWRDADAVLGLCEDGGYWAIGLRAAHPDAVRGVRMSLATTGAEQLARLRGLGLRVRLLPTMRDVDTPRDADAVARLQPDGRFGRLHARLAARVSPLELYEEALAGGTVNVEGGQRRLLDVRKWQGEPDDVDRDVLARCEPADRKSVV